MSAFMVGENHIRQMVALALDGPSGNGPSYPGDRRWYGPRWHADYPDGRVIHKAEAYDPSALMRLLTMENLASIHYRYPDTVTDPEGTPGPNARWWELPIQYGRPQRMATAVEGLSLLNCYEYQSCEHPTWEESEAYAFVQGLRRALINVVTRDDKTWEWSEA